MSDTAPRDRRVLQHLTRCSMDVDGSVLATPDLDLHEGKENAIQNIPLATPTLRTPGTMTHALSPSTFGNRNANPSPERQKPATTVPMDISLEEEKLTGMLKAGRFSTGFTEGVRRESFPGKHVQDLSFNYERAGDESFIGDKSYLSDAQGDRMSVIYERSSTPIQAHEIPLPATVQRAGPSSGSDEALRTVRILASRATPSESDTHKFPFAETITASPIASLKSRAAPQPSRLGMELGAEPEVMGGEANPSSGSDEALRTVRMLASHATPSESDPHKFPFAEAITASPIASLKSRAAPQPSHLGMELGAGSEVLGGEPLKTAKLEPGRGFQFALPERGSPTKWMQPRNTIRGGLSTIAARAAALQFLAAEETFTELDSIIDVQLPEGAEDEFTAAFGRLKIASSEYKVEPKPVHFKHESSSSRKWQEPVASEPTPVDDQKPFARREEPTPDDRKPLATSSNESNPVEAALASDQANSSYVEDEHTLNIASLGLGVENTLLMDTSLDQLRSKPNEMEPGDATFGGASFAIPSSSVIQDEWRIRDILEAKTPKIQRNPSNPLSDPGDTEMDVQTTVKRLGPRPSIGRVVSDAVVDDLRSGRALHKAAASIASLSDKDRRRTLTGAPDEFGSREGAREEQFDWPGSTASLRRTGSTGIHQRTTSLHRTNSTSSHRRVESSRPQSRASIADTELEVEDEAPYIPSAPAMSRVSSRRSSVYAHPEHGNYEDRSPLYYDRPSSVASIRDRPPSAASIRPTSAASIRPPSAASNRSSARPTSNRRLSSGAYLQQGLDNPSQDAEDDLVRGMEALMMNGDAPKPRPGRASIAPDPKQITRKGSGQIRDVGGATRDGRVTSSAVPKAGLGGIRAAATATSGSGARSGLGLNALKKTSSLGLAPKSSSLAAKSTLGARTLGAKPSVGIGAGGAKTVSAATSRTAGLGAKPSALRSQPSSATSTLTRSATLTEQSRRPRASTLGLFAPDGGPGTGEEPKRPTHKAASASVSTTASVTRSLRAPQTASSARSISRGTASTTTGTARVAGSIASLREVMKSRDTISRR